MIRNRTPRRAVWLGSVFVTSAAAIGCVSEPPPAMPVQVPPPDTSVYFYPAKGQSSEQQGRDKYECHTWAVQQSGFDPSAPKVPPHLRVEMAAGPPPGTGVAAGAVTGAVVGAAVSRPWEAGQGVLLGAAAGAVIGSVAESSAVAQARAQAAENTNNTRATLLEVEARNYRRAMTACLEARGYNVH